MQYEYKTMGAPERVRRRPARLSPGERAAAAFGDILNAQAQAGWEYQRTDLIPVAEPRGFWGGTTTAHRAVMVFRRAVAPGAAPAPGSARPEPAAADRAEPEVRLTPPEPAA